MVLKNGDKVLSGEPKGFYRFDELMQFEPIYNSYITATNKLLKLKRTI